MSAYVGWWMCRHFGRLAREGGVAPIARRLRKQGVPLHVALLILTRSP